MEIVLLAAVPIAVVFLLSGIIVNAIQGLVYVFVAPFSKSMHLRINAQVVELLWYQIIWLFDWWAGIQVELFTDSETLKSMGKEHALIMSNHQSDIDWLVGWVFSQRSGCLGSSLAVMKKSSMFLPVVGWAMWFSDFLFIDRRWDKDEKKLESGLKQLKNFPRPFWLALFSEGTRFNQTKLVDAQKYATKQGLPIPRNVLIPRTKGFVSAVNNLRSFVPAIYDATVVVPKTSSRPTMLSMLKGQSSVVHVHIKRHSMRELPQTNESLAIWCRDLFVAKDDLIDEYLAKGTFDTKHRISLGRPIKSFLVVIIWSSLLALVTFRFLKWSCLFSTWRGRLLSSCSVVVAIVVMRIFILFTQAERSTSRVKKV